jgi:CO/xanthine dehydrogenase FAD-binding subunit
VNPAYSDYALPRAADVPNVRVIPIESVDPIGPHGAKGIGEISLVVTPAAVANAVAHATGKRIRDLPITPDKVLGAIAPVDRRRYPIWNDPSVWWVAMIRWAYPRGLHTALRAAAKRLARRSAARPIEQIVTPKTVDAAVQTLQAADHRALAGGTDLVPARIQRLVGETHFVDLTEISELRRITDVSGDLVVGASVTLTELEAHAGASNDHALRSAIASIASPQIRGMATVAGNLCQQKRCWFFRSGFDCYKRGGAACPCYAVLGDHRFYHAAMDAHRCQAVTPSDLGTVLIALDASIGLRSAQARRRLDAADLYSGPGEVALAADEIIVNVRIPAAARQRVTRFEKLGLWAGDFAVASAATALEWDADGRVRSARIVVGGGCSHPAPAGRCGKNPPRRTAGTWQRRRTSRPITLGSSSPSASGQCLEAASGAGPDRALPRIVSPHHRRLTVPHSNTRSCTPKTLGPTR